MCYNYYIRLREIERKMYNMENKILINPDKSEVIWSAADLMIEYDDNIDKIESYCYAKCRCCGYYHHREHGAGEIELNGKTYHQICNDCIDLLKSGIDEDDIPYNEECLEDYKEDEEE